MSSTGTPKSMRYLFGVIMIIIYLAVGILFLCGWFAPLYGSWTWLRWAAGAMFVAYGIWRAYRQFSGLDAEIGDEP